MNTLLEAFAAGIRWAEKTLLPKIRKLEKELDYALHQLALQESILHYLTEQRMTLIMQITDDSAARIKVQDKDRLGAPVTPGTLTATVDNPAKATVSVDPADPTAFLVTRLPLADGDPAVLTVTVTITDTTSGMTGTQAVEFDPGKGASLAFETELAPLPGTAPAAPVVPVAPAVPAPTATPVVPADPAVPTVPVDPVIPAAPVQPVAPVVPDPVAPVVTPVVDPSAPAPSADPAAPVVPTP